MHNLWNWLLLSFCLISKQLTSLPQTERKFKAGLKSFQLLLIINNLIMSKKTGRKRGNTKTKALNHQQTTEKTTNVRNSCWASYVTITNAGCSLLARLILQHLYLFYFFAVLSHFIFVKLKCTQQRASDLGSSLSQNLRHKQHWQILRYCSTSNLIVGGAKISL